MTRKQFLAAGVAGVSALAAGTAHAELVETLSEWRQQDFEGVVRRPAHYRQAYDITEIGNGVFLNNIKNSLNGFEFGFGAKPNEMNVVAALHGNANLLNFNDAMWRKYRLGEFTATKDPKTRTASTRNIFWPSHASLNDKNPDSEQSIYQDHSIEGLMRRKVSFLLCHTATEEQSRKLKERFGFSGSPESIVDDLLAHTIPGAIVVPAMVATIASLQIDHRFSYITIA